MKHITDVMIGDKIWSWDVNKRTPVKGRVTKLFVMAETEDDDGNPGRACLVTLASLYADELIAHEVPESPLEVHKVRADDLDHRLNYHALCALDLEEADEEGQDEPER